MDIRLADEGEGQARSEVHSPTYNPDDTWPTYYSTYGAKRDRGAFLMQFRRQSGTVPLDDIHIYPV